MNEIIKNKHPNTKWEQVKEDIELKIISGVYVGTERLPSSSEFKEIYGVGKSTTDRALKELENDGIISVRRGIGSFVKPLKRELLREKYLKELHEIEDRMIRLSLMLGIDERTLCEEIKGKLSPHGEYKPV